MQVTLDHIKIRQKLKNALRGQPFLTEIKRGYEARHLIRRKYFTSLKTKKNTSLSVIFNNYSSVRATLVKET